MKPPSTVEARVAEELRNWLSSELEQLDAPNTNQFAHHVVTILLHEDLDIEDEPLSTGDDFLHDIYSIRRGKTRDTQRKAAVQFLRSAVCCNEPVEADIQVVVDELMVRIEETKNKMSTKLSPKRASVNTFKQSRMKSDSSDRDRLRLYNEAFPCLHSNSKGGGTGLADTSLDVLRASQQPRLADTSLDVLRASQQDDCSRQREPMFNSQQDDCSRREPMFNSQQDDCSRQREPMFNSQEEALACLTALQVFLSAFPEAGLPSFEATEILSLEEVAGCDSFSPPYSCWSVQSAFRACTLLKKFVPTVSPLRQVSQSNVGSRSLRQFSPTVIPVIKQSDLHTVNLDPSYEKTLTEHPQLFRPIKAKQLFHWSGRSDTDLEVDSILSCKQAGLGKQDIGSFCPCASTLSEACSLSVASRHSKGESLHDDDCDNVLLHCASSDILEENTDIQKGILEKNTETQKGILEENTETQKGIEDVGPDKSAVTGSDAHLNQEPCTTTDVGQNQKVGIVRDIDSDKKVGTVRDIDSDKKVGTVRDIDSDKKVGTVRDIDLDKKVGTVRDIDSDKKVGIVRDIDLDKKVGTVRDIDSDKKVGTVRDIDLDKKVGTVRDIDSDKKVGIVRDIDLDKKVGTVRDIDSDKKVGTVRDIDLDKKVGTVRDIDLDKKVGTVRDIDLDKKVGTVTDIDLDKTVGTVRDIDLDKKVGTVRDIVLDKKVGTVTDIDLDKTVGTVRDIDLDKKIGTVRDIDLDKKVGTTGNESMCFELLIPLEKYCARICSQAMVEGVERAPCSSSEMVEGVVRALCSNSEVVKGVERALCSNSEVVEGVVRALCSNSEVVKGVERAPCSSSEMVEGVEQAPCSSSEMVEGVEQAPCSSSEMVESGERAPCNNSEMVESVERAPCSNSEMVKGVERAPCSSSEKVEGVERAPCSSSEMVESVERALQRAPCSSSEMVECVERAPCSSSEMVESVKRAPCSSSEMVESVERAPCSSSELVEGVVRASCSSSEVVEGVERALCSSSEMVEGVERALCSSSEMVKGVERALCSSSEMVEGVVRALCSNSEMVEGVVRALCSNSEMVEGVEQAPCSSSEMVESVERAPCSSSEMGDLCSFPPHPGGFWKHLADAGTMDLFPVVSSQLLLEDEYHVPCGKCLRSPSRCTRLHLSNSVPCNSKRTSLKHCFYHSLSHGWAQQWQMETARIQKQYNYYAAPKVDSVEDEEMSCLRRVQNPFMPSLLSSCLSQEDSQFLQRAFVNSYFSDQVEGPGPEVQTTHSALRCSDLEHWWLSKDTLDIAGLRQACVQLVPGCTCSSWLENNCHLGDLCPFSHPRV